MVLSIQQIETWMQALDIIFVIILFLGRSKRFFEADLSWLHMEIDGETSL